MLEVKTQILSSIPETICCCRAFINTILFSQAQIDEEQTSIFISCKKYLSDKIFRVLTKLYPNLEINAWDDFLLVTSHVKQIIKDCVLDKNNLSECDKLTILKSIFVVSGRFYYTQDENKNSKGYSLEISLKDIETATFTQNLLKDFGFDLKTISRQNYLILYTKNSNIICDLLVLLGASNTTLQIQNKLALREIRNSINRQNNCFESNLEKTLNASSEQVEAINYILKNYSLDYLDENLKEVALARLVNPDVSLNEMRQLLTENISRAGIKYRLDKIINIYKKLKGEKE